MTFDEVLRQVRLEMLAAHRNQEMPYEQMVKKLQTKRDPSYNLFFQVGFTFEPPMELEFAGVEITTQKIHNQEAQLDLFLNLLEKEEEVHGLLNITESCLMTAHSPASQDITKHYCKLF